MRLNHHLSCMVITEIGEFTTEFLVNSEFLYLGLWWFSHVKSPENFLGWAMLQIPRPGAKGTVLKVDKKSSSKVTTTGNRAVAYPLTKLGMFGIFYEICGEWNIWCGIKQTHERCGAKTCVRDVGRTPCFVWNWYRCWMRKFVTMEVKNVEDSVSFRLRMNGWSMFISCPMNFEVGQWEGKSHLWDTWCIGVYLHPHQCW